MYFIPIVFFISRILFGGFFIMQGWNHLKNHAGLTGYALSKKVPLAKVAVIASGIMFLVGGIGIIIGFSGMFLKIASLLVILPMVPITFMMHAYWKETDPQARMMQNVQFYKNIAIIAGALLFFTK